MQSLIGESSNASFTVADPGFPVGGGVDLVGGGVDSRGSYVSKILYVKMKELGPLGGARAGRAPLDLPMVHTKQKGKANATSLECIQVNYIGSFTPSESE